MVDFLRFAGGLVADLLRTRTTLLAENATLRQQLIVAERQVVGRARWFIDTGDVACSADSAT
jgi:hypothetical protein